MNAKLSILGRALRAAACNWHNSEFRPSRRTALKLPHRLEFCMY